MIFPFFAAFLAPAFLATEVSARTDLSGCVSSDTVAFGGASVIWYVPGSGEICDFLDCGGGRAPPKTTVPGCPLYSGTATYSPSYLPGYGSSTIATSTSAAAQSETSSSTEDDDTTILTGTRSATITSAATLTTTGTTASTGGSGTASSSQSVSTGAAPLPAVTGPLGIAVGLMAAGAAALL
ncbi:hypothetical protein BX600DRAFT_443645 [Xylariales sp. PMI_506]|nr:hypothetical protein BX600DRAFT_443645 [Xylariales sp. PMI_506]